MIFVQNSSKSATVCIARNRALLQFLHLYFKLKLLYSNFFIQEKGWRIQFRLEKIIDIFLIFQAKNNQNLLQGEILHASSPR